MSEFIGTVLIGFDALLLLAAIVITLSGRDRWPERRI